jgi:hypothetical protein
VNHNTKNNDFFLEGPKIFGRMELRPYPNEYTNIAITLPDILLLMPADISCKRLQ